MKPSQWLEARGLHPKKALGQNFLTDARVPADMVDVVRASNIQGALEIGPGLGALTIPLCTAGIQVTALERDPDLLEALQGTEHLTVHLADATKEDWGRHLVALPTPRAVVGNLPYSVTGLLLRQACLVRPLVELCLFMVQSEVADRLIAKPSSKDYGALTVFVQAQYAVSRVRRVSKSSFLPAPNVESTIVRMVPATEPIPETPMFARLVKASFEQRRKTLRNAWRGLGPLDALEAAAVQADISLNARGETLSPQDFQRMAEAFGSELA